MRLDNRLERARLGVLDHLRDNLAALTVEHGENDGLVGVGIAAPLAGLVLAADQRLVGFNVAVQRTLAVEHGEVLPDLMAHAPSGLVRAAELALQLLGRN